ncbi:DUF1534 domain-containing protein [Pseudomonas fluorescens]|nr:DUF1534 domain-containing protein [Pseudomonas fluorescens]
MEFGECRSDQTGGATAAVDQPVQGLADSDRSHVEASNRPRGNASTDAPRSALDLGRGAPRAAFPRGAWERSKV